MTALPHTWSSPLLARWCLAALLCAAASYAEDGARPGSIQFSDGSVINGTLSLTPGTECRIASASRLRSFPLSRISEMRFTPEVETMEQRWRFPVAGQTRKEKWGKPYPVRNLLTTLVLTDGATLTGHLYTTVIYVASPSNAAKVVLLAKQRGSETDTFATLTYPVRLLLEASTATVAAAAIRVPAGMVALTRGALARLESHDELLGDAVFRATMQTNVIAVGWPSGSDTNSRAAVETALPHIRDFFEQHTLVAVWRDPASGDLYSLMMLVRTGSTLLPDGAPALPPWRCEIWRWKQVPEEQKLLFAGRGWLFRGELTPGSKPPAVMVSPALWSAP